MNSREIEEHCLNYNKKTKEINGKNWPLVNIIANLYVSRIQTFALLLWKTQFVLEKWITFFRQLKLDGRGKKWFNQLMKSLDLKRILNNVINHAFSSEKTAKDFFHHLLELQSITNAYPHELCLFATHFGSSFTAVINLNFKQSLEKNM